MGKSYLLIILIILYVNSFSFLKKQNTYIFDYYYKRLIFLALVQSVYSYGISILGGAANNVLSRLIVTINCNITFLLNLPMTTNTSSIYKDINVNHLKCIYKSKIIGACRIVY